MSKRLSAILIFLVLLTLGGLVLVSNFIGTNKVTSEAAVPVPNFSVTPKMMESPKNRPSATKAEVAADLEQALMQLSALTESIKTNDWVKAKNLSDAFALKNQRLPLPQLNTTHSSPILQDFFDLYSVQLDRAIADKQTRPALIALNQLGGIINEAQAHVVQRSLPVEVQRLHYLVRELALWKEVGDDKMLAARKAALGEAWSDVSALLKIKRNSEPVTQEFGALVNQIVGAENAQKLIALWPELNTKLASVDSLFQRKSENEKDSDDDDE